MFQHNSLIRASRAIRPSYRFSAIAQWALKTGWFSGDRLEESTDFSIVRNKYQITRCSTVARLSVHFFANIWYALPIKNRTGFSTFRDRRFEISCTRPLLPRIVLWIARVQGNCYINMELYLIPARNLLVIFHAGQKRHIKRMQNASLSSYHLFRRANRCTKFATYSLRFAFETTQPSYIDFAKRSA